MPSRKRLFLLDANALLHRAWHALPLLTNADGKPVNALYGVLLLVAKLLHDHKPDAIIACWDTDAPTFRHQAYEQYKAQRESQPDELYAQIPWSQEALQLIGIPSVFLDGYEADDLIGSLAHHASREWEVTAVSSDRDLLQLVQNHITIMLLKKGVSDVVSFDSREVQRVYGLTPERFVDYKALRGDPSDNIPGVKGIGEKGATELIQTFASITGIVKAAHDPQSSMSKSLRAKILDAETQLPGILKLVRIELNAPVNAQQILDDCHRGTDDEIRVWFLRMGLKSLIARFVREGTPSSARSADAHPLVTTTAQWDQMETTLRIHANEPVCVWIAHGAQGSLFSAQTEAMYLSQKSVIACVPRRFIQSQAGRERAQQFLQERSLTFVAHDAKQVMHDLAVLGIEGTHWSFDTMLAAYVLAAHEHAFDLASLVARYLPGAVPDVHDSVQAIQAVQRLALVLSQALETEGLRSVLDRFELPLIPVLFDMERQGIRVDAAYLKRLSIELTTDKERLEHDMRKHTGEAFNPASPQQLAHVFFEVLKLPTKGIKKGKMGYSTAAPELEKLRALHPLIKQVEDHRELAKLLSTYVDVLPALADRKSRIHTCYRQAVASTGRLSSSDPNLQNIPVRTELGRRIRRAFIAEHGFQLVSCDYSQIELRLAAALAKDTRMLEAFHRGEDIHASTASAMWHVPLAEVSVDQRRAAKAINFGILYGQGPHGLAASAGVSVDEARAFIDAYFSVYHGVYDFLERAKKEGKKRGFAETFFARRRPLPELSSSLPQIRAQGERIAINMPLQGTAADIMKLAMIAVHGEMKHVSDLARVLLQVHDELILEVPEKEVLFVTAFVKETMEHVVQLDVELVVEAKAGSNWSDMKDVKRYKTC